MGRDEDRDAVLRATARSAAPRTRRAPPDRPRRSARRGSASPARGSRRRRATGAAACPAAGRSARASATLREAEARDHLVDARRRCARRGRWKMLRVQLEVLPHRQLAIEREALRHVADALAASPCRRRRRRGRTATPRPRWRGSSPVSIFIVVDLPQPLEPRKPKISPRSMRKLTWSTAVKSPNRACQVRGLDGRRAVGGRRAAGSTGVRWPRRLSLGQQRDERALRGSPRRRVAMSSAGRAGREDPAGIHRDQPVEALGLLHVGGGDEHAHAGPLARGCGR